MTDGEFSQSAAPFGAQSTFADATLATPLAHTVVSSFPLLLLARRLEPPGAVHGETNFGLEQVFGHEPSIGHVAGTTRFDRSGICEARNIAIPAPLSI